MNSKTTKRALLSSVVAMLVCFTMLLSTTFAWFTDTAVSGSNVIVSGKLDVALIDANDASLEGEVIEWAAKDGRAQDKILWEPGCTYETESFYVKNNGNLALKYQVVINGIDGDAKLLEAIEWTVTVGGVETDLSTFEGKLYPTAGSDKSEAIILSGHMKEDAGNEYQDLTVNGISISVFATQLDAETDTFGPDYDEDAVYGDYFVTDAAALADAFANAENGDVIVLMDDMDIAQLSVAKGKDIVLNLNGSDLTATSANDSGNQWGIQVKGNLAVVGNGTVTMNHTGADMGWSALSAAFSVEGGTLTLGEGIVVTHKGGTAMAYAVDVNSTLGATTLNVDGAIISSSYIGIRLFNNNKTNAATVNLNSGVVDGTRRDIWVHNPSANAVDANGVVNFADGYVYTETVQDASSNYGRIYDFATSVAVVNDAGTLKNAIDNGTDVIYASGITYDQKLSFGKVDNAIFVDCTFTGNGSWGYANDATFENCTFDSGADDVACMHFDKLCGTAVVKNCTFKSGEVQIGTDGSSEITFENCTFADATDTSIWNAKGIRVYSPATFVNCEFNNRVVVAGSNGLAIAFDSCTMNGGTPVYYVDNTNGIIRGGNVPAVTIK